MSRPENPSTIVIKNRFYPKGLTEGQVWDYYQKYKGPILSETRGRDLMFVIMTDVNKPVIRRKGAGGKPIVLTNSNYDKVLTGRTLVIYSTMRAYEDVGIIDIDADRFKQAQQATLDVYYVMRNFQLSHNIIIRFTGKTSFHVVCKLYRKLPIDKIRLLLHDHLTNSDLKSKYTIAYRRTKGTPNLDLSPNKFRGAFITLNSLSLIGLRCVEVLFNRVDTFHPISTTIK